MSQYEITVDGVVGPAVLGALDGFEARTTTRWAARDWSVRWSTRPRCTASSNASRTCTWTSSTCTG